jgi:hypothetical protein
MPNQWIGGNQSVQPATLSLRASRASFSGGEPGELQAYRPKRGDIDPTKINSALGERDADGNYKETLGLGQCQHPVTRVKCQHWHTCQANILELRCYVAEAHEAAQVERLDAAQKQATDGERMLAYMRHVDQPVTFSDICADLGYAETPLLLQGSFRALQRDGKIVPTGETRPSRRSSHPINLWVVAHGEAIPVPPVRRPEGRKPMHIASVMAVLRQSGKPMTCIEVNVVLKLEGSRVSNCLIRLHSKGKLARQMRQISPRDSIWEYWIVEETK